MIALMPCILNVAYRRCTMSVGDDIKITTGWFLMDCCCIKIIYLMHQCNMSRASSKLYINC